MDEYIRKGKALSMLTSLPTILDAETVQRAIEAIRATPAADAVEVIRCKDCKYWTKVPGTNQGLCRLLKIHPTGAWYCANGKREGVKRFETQK